MVTAEAWQALAVADRGVVDHVWRVGGEDRLVTASLGITLIRPDEDAASALERADRACYAAKSAGRDACKVAI